MKKTLHMRIGEIVTAAAIAAVVSACSVKEDRGDCPCFVTLDFIGDLCEPLSVRFIDESGPSLDTEMRDVRFSSSGTMTLTDAEVPRKEYSVVAWCGSERTAVLSDRIVAVFGEEMDSVRTGKIFLDTRSESARATVRMNRQFCEIRVKVVGSVTPGYPFTFRVEGNVGGVMLAGGCPVRGEFSFCPELSGGGFSVNVPRQFAGEDTLVLEIMENGSVRNSLPLGLYIANTGYDWDAESLVPVDILLDFARASAYVTVSDWGLGWQTDNFEI